MTADEKKAILDYADHVFDAAMKFAMETNRARYDLERSLNGEKPLGPVFIDRKKAIQEHYENNVKRAKRAKRART